MTAAEAEFWKRLVDDPVSVEGIDTPTCTSITTSPLDTSSELCIPPNAHSIRMRIRAEYFRAVQKE